MRHDLSTVHRTFQRSLSLIAAMLAFVGMLTSPATAQTAANDIQTVWRLLDYIAVDYEGAVSKGKVISATEYAEMREFVGTVKRGIRDLPETPARASLETAVGEIEVAIAAKTEPSIVAARSRQLASRLLSAYPVPLAPRSLPDLAKGSKLYSENCASCHGASGNGQGPLGTISIFREERATS